MLVHMITCKAGLSQKKNNPENNGIYIKMQHFVEFDMSEKKHQLYAEQMSYCRSVYDKNRQGQERIAAKGMWIKCKSECRKIEVALIMQGD